MAETAIREVNLNNADFIDGLRKQDPIAARHLNECFVPSVWRFVYFRVDRDSHLAEDIVAEVVLALVNAAASETSIDHPAAWLRTVAQRRIQDHFRAVARVQHLIEQAQQQPNAVDNQDPAAQHDRQLERQSVRDAMEGLPETYRMALEWKYVDQLSVKVIAERLETTEKSAESILFRARNALRKELKSENPEPPRQNNATNHANPAVQSSDASQSNKESGNEADSTTEIRASIFFASRLAREN